MTSYHCILIDDPRPKEFRKGVRQALSLCDKAFGDYRERKKKD